jgi:hypothetical protein
MRGFGRWFGYLLLVLAIAVAAWDGVEAFRTRSAYQAETLGEMWSSLNRSSLDTVEAASPWTTERIVAPVLAWPAWLVLGVPGAVLAIACWRRTNQRRRHRRSRI